MADLRRKDCRGRKEYGDRKRGAEVVVSSQLWCVVSKAGQRRGDLRAMSRQPRI